MGASAPETSAASLTWYLASLAAGQSTLHRLETESYSIGTVRFSPESKSSTVNRAETNGIEGSMESFNFEPLRSRKSPRSLDRVDEANLVYSGNSIA